MKTPALGLPKVPKLPRQRKLPTDAAMRKKINDAWRRHREILKQIAGE